MGETDTDAADQFDARITSAKLNEGTKGLWRRYRRLPRNVFAISLVSLLNDASSEIIYPFLPVFLSLTLGASPGIVGIVEGTAESVSSLLKLFAGYFSDRRGKRKSFVVLGYSLASFARPLLAFATSWYQVFAIRLTDRVGKGIRSAPRDAMIADTVAFEERGLAFGFHRAMDHTGAMVGPLIRLFAAGAVCSEPQRADCGGFHQNIFAGFDSGAGCCSRRHVFRQGVAASGPSITSLSTHRSHYRYEGSTATSNGSC